MQKDKPQIPTHIIQRQLCLKSFYHFLVIFWDIIIAEDYVDNWHIQYLCDELQEIGERVKRREPNEYDLAINVPPGSSKTTIATVMFPVWLWVIDESMRILTSSYSSTLSMDHSVKSRDIIKSDRFIKMFPELKIRNDFDNKNHYKNTGNGERFATSVRGTITGFHAHVLIVDDPLNPKEASSDKERENANNFLTSTLSTRKVNKALTPTILIMQRLHEEDPTGLWLQRQKEGAKIKHICLPAELSQDLKPAHLSKFYVNGLLDANRMPKDVLNAMRIDLGSYGYAGQMMQTPSPAEGGIFKAEHFKTITDDELNEIAESITLVGSDWDLAYTKNETNSASAYVTAGKYDGKMYVLDIGFDWLEFPKLIHYMKTKTAPHYIEAKASGKSAKQTLTNQGIPAIEVNVDGGDKIARATMASPYVESGMVIVRQSLLNKLLHDDKQGLMKFPNAQEDLTDAFVQSVNRLLGQPQTFFF